MISTHTSNPIPFINSIVNNELCAVFNLYRIRFEPSMVQDTSNRAMTLDNFYEEEFKEAMRNHTPCHLERLVIEHFITMVYFIDHYAVDLDATIDDLLLTEEQANHPDTKAYQRRLSNQIRYCQNAISKL